MNFGLSKEERISSVSAIEDLIAKGRHMSLGIIRCCYHQRRSETTEGQQAEPLINRMMVSVPKKLFKRAVKRNLLKRRIREAYRLQKHTLDGVSGVDIMFVYNTKEVADFAKIHEAVGAALSRIAGHGKQREQQ